MNKITKIGMIFGLGMFFLMPVIFAQAPNPQYPATTAIITSFGSVSWTCDSCDLNFTQTVVVVYGAPTAEYIAKKHAVVLHIEQELGKPATFESKIKQAIIDYGALHGYNVTGVYMPKYQKI